MFGVGMRRGRKRRTPSAICISSGQWPTYSITLLKWTSSNLIAGKVTTDSAALCVLKQLGVVYLSSILSMLFKNMPIREGERACSKMLPRQQDFLIASAGA
jgi:hypothetical protein